MDRKTQNIFFSIILGLSGLPAKAETLTFTDVWQKVKSVSPAQEAANFKMQAAEAGYSRSENHWLPHLYLDAKTYRTNDPGNSFFGLLEQRKVAATDFAAASLNQPDAQTFTRGALGLDLPLYEGGAKQAQTEMFSHLVNVEKYGASQLQVEQYGQVGMAYATIAVLRKQKNKLLEVSGQVEKLAKGYQLGQKSNPVGYSGLLGMKSLNIRLAGLIDQHDAQVRASYLMLKETGVTAQNWEPQEFDARTFTAKYFPSTVNSNQNLSGKAAASVESAKMAAEVSKMERARYLPRVGAFAESYMFNGNRDTANGYNAGLYLQWNLFDPADFGKYKEAKLNSMAAESMARATAQQECAERQGLIEADTALRSNLEKLDESEKLLAEQMQVSATLFKNGSMSALQFVEIMNRRTDLIAQQIEAELALLRTSVELASKSKFEIPVVADSGGGR